MMIDDDIASIYYSVIVLLYIDYKYTYVDDNVFVLLPIRFLVVVTKSEGSFPFTETTKNKHTHTHTLTQSPSTTQYTQN